MQNKPADNSIRTRRVAALLFTRAWKFALFAAIQGGVCLLLSLLVGLLQIQVDLAAGKVNEFVGLYLVIGLWLGPIYWLISTPAHLFFYIRQQPPSSYLLSTLASSCVVLVGSVYFQTLF